MSAPSTASFPNGPTGLAVPSPAPPASSNMSHRSPHSPFERVLDAHFYPFCGLRPCPPGGAAPRVAHAHGPIFVFRTSQCFIYIAFALADPPAENKTSGGPREQRGAKNTAERKGLAEFLYPQWAPVWFGVFAAINAKPLASDPRCVIADPLRGCITHNHACGRSPSGK
jgi:hypothetical protein